MAELLIYVRDDPLTGDPNIDNMRHKRGDVITVQPDGWAWTGEENKAVWIAGGRLASQWPRTFVLLKIPGVSASKIRNLTAPWNDVAGELYRRKQRFIDIDAAPSQIRNKIGSDFEITVTPSQIRNFIKRKSDGAVFDPGFD
jgi:hypothetical protein